ncbi:hypothetical protein GGS23DRAFT_596929 [Durotheca rogersii]|uniref:uncharacterized protein n=1 Tax=Durotheca rogersii TaxID=419775 RepID=UPI00221E8DEB|nr:uncharacterized protein GGS23DRAFT_596929 [Durotheca rogersii]KAI5863159.1 hypothetical protein GGS23DRAFT_596929 [Durotheca rogersii]
MLDENLPAFTFRQSSNNPLLSILYFSQNGSEPAPEYSIRKINPALPESRGKYAVALGDAAIQDVIFAEVLIEPEFQRPALSAAEARQPNAAPPPPVPLIPDGFTIQLYNPEQQVAMRGEKSTWTGKESWEFEIPQQSFRRPSASQLDRQQNDPVASSLTPKVLFKWKRDSKFSRDMTCYMTGTSVGGKKSKDPDITIAFYKHGREPGLTIYEPNLQRVDVEDRKGLEIVLLLSAEVIREIYLSPSRDSFNIGGGGGGGAANRRRNSRPAAAPSASPAHVMTGALGIAPPGGVASPTTPPRDAGLDAETKRLQALVQQEEREREAREREEEARTRRMLEAEAREQQRRRDAEVARETERLRREFGLAGQSFGPAPRLPPRSPAAPGQPFAPQLQVPVPPARPVSAGPQPHGRGGFGTWFHGLGPMAGPPPPQQQHGRRRVGSADSDRIRKIQSKKSTLF